MQPDTVICEYDGTELTLTEDGLEPACPKCQEEIEAHMRECLICRLGDRS